jgi:ribonuclease-3
MVDNERLEFLGDAILDAVIAEYLYRIYPEQDEGFLTQLRSKIVKRKQLNKLAQKLGMSILIKSNTSMNQGQKNILGNAFEALIGAVYLDKGYLKTKKFIIDRILARYLDLEKLSQKESDYKSRLIEWAQKNKKEISFVSKEEINVGSRKMIFMSNVLIMDQSYGTGAGYSKKEAEQKAAEQALLKVMPA